MVRPNRAMYRMLARSHPICNCAKDLRLVLIASNSKVEGRVSCKNPQAFKSFAWAAHHEDDSMSSQKLGESPAGMGADHYGLM